MKSPRKVSPECEQYIGKTLAEVELMHKHVRVTGAGNVQFMGTCDYRPDRLNVSLAARGLQFESKTITVLEEEYVIEEVVGSMDHGIVIDARFG